MHFRPEHAEGQDPGGNVQHGSPADPEDRGPEGQAGPHHQGAAAAAAAAPGAPV